MYHEVKMISVFFVSIQSQKWCSKLFDIHSFFYSNPLLHQNIFGVRLFIIIIIYKHNPPRTRFRHPYAHTDTHIYLLTRIHTHTRKQQNVQMIFFGNVSQQTSENLPFFGLAQIKSKSAKIIFGLFHELWWPRYLRAAVWAFQFRSDCHRADQMYSVAMPQQRLGFVSTICLHFFFGRAPQYVFCVSSCWSVL